MNTTIFFIRLVIVYFILLMFERQEGKQKFLLSLIVYLITGSTKLSKTNFLLLTFLYFKNPANQSHIDYK